MVRELVEYVPEASFHGWRAPFVKPDRFAYQSEARFAVVGRRDEVLQVELGPLHDIAEPVLTSALFELEYDLSEEDSDEK